MPIDSFTGKEIPKGKGLMYVKKDGTAYWFAGKKSEKNFLKLHRSPSETKWTNTYHKEKEIRIRGKDAKPSAKNKAKAEAK